MLLGAQDGECVKCASEVSADENEGGITADVDGRDSSRMQQIVHLINSSTLTKTNIRKRLSV